MSAAPSKGVVLFGVTLILGAVYQMWLVFSAGYVHYCYLHQQYDSTLLFIRYLVSWGIKIAGLLLGVGLLQLNEWARKLTIYYFIFIVLTVNLKHAYPAYLMHMKMLDASTGGGPYPGMSFESLVLPALFIQRAVDVVFGIAIIFFLSRPKVKEQFKRVSHGANS